MMTNGVAYPQKNVYGHYEQDVNPFGTQLMN